jgi:hypothetical protein
MSSLTLKSFMPKQEDGMGLYTNLSNLPNLILCHGFLPRILPDLFFFSQTTLHPIQKEKPTNQTNKQKPCVIKMSEKLLGHFYMIMI